MSMPNLRAGYFAIDNPLRRLDRWIHKYRHHQTARIDQRDVEVWWTDRAETALRSGQQPLIVELQLYFSCVVKKRVLFHRQVDFETTAVNGKLELAFRPIASAVCDPAEFALSHPVGKDLSPGIAARMVPRRVEIDFRRGDWQGRFHY